MKPRPKQRLTSNGFQRRDCCSLCGGPVTPIIDLPALPLTDTYCTDQHSDQTSEIDQQLLYCKYCSHGQLAVLLPSSVLYERNYFFRTSLSATARKGTAFFLSVIDETALDRKFRCALDIGCNDLFLLNSLKNRSELRIGIDPVWKNREAEQKDPTIQVFGSNFEEIDFGSFPAKPDLIVCRHTLEHLIDPLGVLKSLMNIAADDALFVFEVPGFDSLIQRFRFDQVFHQHTQYFTLCSFMRLLTFVDGKYLIHRTNFHDWGAMAVAFSRGNTTTPLPARGWSTDEIADRYQLFRRQVRNAGEILRVLANRAPIYGYGAAQMLPVLGYHMITDFSELVAVIDDDITKDGVGYSNLPVKIQHSGKVTDLNEATVLITALDNIQPIMIRLLEKRPRHIINPLNII